MIARGTSSINENVSGSERLHHKSLMLDLNAAYVQSVCVFNNSRGGAVTAAATHHNSLFSAFSLECGMPSDRFESP